MDTQSRHAMDTYTRHAMDTQSSDGPYGNTAIEESQDQISVQDLCPDIHPSTSIILVSSKELQGV